MGIRVAVPITVPEGCVGRVDVRVRWKVQGEVVVVARFWKSVEGRDAEIDGCALEVEELAVSDVVSLGIGCPVASTRVSCDVGMGVDVLMSLALK